MEKLERVRGDRYALSVLKNRRASLASEIVEMERKLRHLRESLVHVDATLIILNPDAHPEQIPNKRPVRRVKLFKQGELGRLIVDTLRRADGKAMTLREVVSAIMEVGELGEDARRSLSPRVRGNLAYLRTQGKVERSDDGDAVRWSLP